MLFHPFSESNSATWSLSTPTIVVKPQTKLSAYRYYYSGSDKWFRCTIEWEGNSVSWYTNEYGYTYGVEAAAQFNRSNEVYYYVAIG